MMIHLYDRTRLDGNAVRSVDDLTACQAAPDGINTRVTELVAAVTCHGCLAMLEVDSALSTSYQDRGQA